ncbi:hypothetical protein MAP00_002323 [Monascus purpureus]|nr:hypothetical protein MAP00_002323 [Monascus purpureus]
MLNLETLVTRSSLVKLGSPIVIALTLGMSFMCIALDRQIKTLSAFEHLPRGFQRGHCIRSSLGLSQNPRKRQPGGFGGIRELVWCFMLSTSCPSLRFTSSFIFCSVVLSARLGSI